MLQYDELWQNREELSEEVGVVVVRKTPTCGGNDGCGWGSVWVVLLVGALVVPRIAPAVSQNWTVHWWVLREELWQDLSLKQNDRAKVGI